MAVRRYTKAQRVDIISVQGKSDVPTYNVWLETAELRVPVVYSATGEAARRLAIDYANTYQVPIYVNRIPFSPGAIK